MATAFKAGGRVKVTDKQSEFFGETGVIKDKAAPDTGHAGPTWNVTLDGHAETVKLDAKHISHE